MACATPVVGVSEAGLRESLVDGVTGLLTDRDAAAFGDALNRVLRQPNMAKHLGENGRKMVVDRWTWKRSVDVLERCFHQVLESGPRRQ
jgi:glycosyltransferase involved in cell wall biosynthesis